MPTAGATSVIALEDMVMAIRHRRPLPAPGRSTVRLRRIILRLAQTRAADLLPVVSEGRPMAGANHRMVVVPLRAAAVEDLPAAAAASLQEASQLTQAKRGRSKTRPDKDDLLVGPVRTVPDRGCGRLEVIHPEENPPDGIVNRLESDQLLHRHLLEPDRSETDY